jgi:hypothetical protein
MNMNPIVWFTSDPLPWTVGAALLLVLFIFSKVWFSKPRPDSYLTRGMVVYVGIGIFLGMIIWGISRQYNILPRSSELTPSEVDPSPPQQEGMVDAARKVRQMTNKTETDKNGNVKFVTEHTSKGWQPVAANSSMKDLTAVLSGSLKTRNDEWQKNPESVIGQGASAKLYERKRAESPLLFKSGLEPLLAMRFGWVLIQGKRAPYQKLIKDEPNFLCYINVDAPGQLPAKVALDPLPYEKAVKFDSFMVWLTAYCGAPMHPHVARWCKAGLEAEGKGFFASPLGFEERYLDSSYETNWDPENLSALGKRIDEALLATGELPASVFGNGAQAFMTGLEGTPFKGRGMSHNIAALIWGEDLEGHFKGNHIRALRCAAFLALNPRARLTDYPKKTYDDEASANRLYASRVVNHWHCLSGYEPIGEAFGETDPSLQWLQHQTGYAQQAAPPNGDYKLLTESQLAEEKRRRAQK